MTAVSFIAVPLAAVMMFTIVVAVLVIVQVFLIIIIMEVSFRCVFMVERAIIVIVLVVSIGITIMMLITIVVAIISTIIGFVRWFDASSMIQIKAKAFHGLLSDSQISLLVMFGLHLQNQVSVGSEGVFRVDGACILLEASRCLVPLA